MPGALIWSVQEIKIELLYAGTNEMKDIQLELCEGPTEGSYESYIIYIGLRAFPSTRGV